MTTAPPDAATPPPETASPWVELAAGLAPVLAHAAGPGALLVSVTFELGRGDVSPPVSFTARLDRGGRSLAFVSGEARGADGALCAAATAVFSRR